ncbi:MAG: MurR/RpiR family transcriptional regulator, partial [Enterococcus sp.]|nr:MurR/RpiR family transcriptional regulator [Enterococcus sp.]
EIPFVGFKSEGSYFPDYEVRSRLPLQIIARILLDSYALRVTDN